MQKRLFIILLLLFHLGQGYAVLSLSMSNLNITNGLSNNYVKDVAQDRQGFIWIATEAGLNRFDGCQFTRYTSTNSELKTDAINTLLYDEQNNLLWIGTRSDLTVLDCSTYKFTHYGMQDNIHLNNIVSMSLAGDTAIWIATHYNGILHCNKKTMKFTSYTNESIPELKNSNWCIFDDGHGKIYVGHSLDGLTIINAKDLSALHYKNEPDNSSSLPGNSVYSICVDHMGNTWVGTNQGLALFQPEKGEFQSFKHDEKNPNSIIADHIYDIKQMDDATVWIASDIGGISILDLYNLNLSNRDSVRFNNITATSSGTNLSSGNIRSLLQDSFGNIWIGNYSSGLDFISHTEPLFKILPYIRTVNNKIKNKQVWGVYADSEGKVWVGGENEVSIFENNQLLRSINISQYQSRPYTQVFTLCGNRQGIILLGTFDDGLLEFDSNTGKVHRIDLGIEHVDVFTIKEATDGTMWIGVEYGLYTYQNGKIHREEKIISQLVNQSVYGIAHDRQGKIWIGTNNSGVSIFNYNHELVHRLNAENGFFSNAVNSLYMDSKGGIWIATRNGIGYVEDTKDPDHFEMYGKEEGLEDCFVRSILEDEAGNIWLSTNQGISLWNKEEKTFSNYDHNDGIPAGNFIEGSSCLSADGTAYFGSLNGVSYFNPAFVLKKQSIAPIQLIECKEISVSKDNVNIENIIPITEEEINFSHHENSFSISFAVPDYAQSKQVEYAYILEGFYKNWVKSNGENTAVFRNIPPGKYTFRVKARLKNQVWDESRMVSLNIHIHPPFWFTWYAWFFYILLACIIIIFYILSYQRKLKLKSLQEIEKQHSLNEQNLNNERLQFYTNITHELRTPLTLIIGPLEDLADDKKIPEVYRSKINSIHGSAMRLLNLINQLLEFRKTETNHRQLIVCKGNLTGLVTEIGLRYKELNCNPDVKIQIKTGELPIQIYYDPEIITTILNNLLSNAIKYTHHGEIIISLSCGNETSGNYAIISVSDTGCGIEPDELPHIFERYYQGKGKYQASGTGIGLALVKSLATLHQGMLEVKSVVGKGTTFTFRILADYDYPDAMHKEVASASEVVDMAEEDSEQDNRLLLLVIEDNEDIRKYIVSSFNTEYKVLEGSNGKEGLEIALSTIPNIIVSDIMMPQMDGIQLCRAIKEDIRTSHIPVILLTAKDSMQDKEEGYESGADSYLTKPFSAKLLRTRMLNLLESRARLAKRITDSSLTGSETESAIFIEEPLKLSNLDEAFLKKTTEIIEENINDEKLDIIFLTQQIGMSHSTMYRKIKALTGITINEYIRKIRLRRSMQLLQTGDYNVSEAAYMSGFNTMSYFRTCFKNEYGYSPSEVTRAKNNNK